MADNFCQEEPPFAAFCPTRLFRPTTAVWVIVGMEMVCISAKNLLRSAYQDRRLYHLAPQIFELIDGLPPEAASVFARGRKLEGTRWVDRSLGRN